MSRHYMFNGKNGEDIYALSAQNILWFEETEPTHNFGGHAVPLLKVFGQRSANRPVEIRSNLANLVPMEDFRYWLPLSLPTGRAVSVNPEKIESLQHRPGGTDICFKSHQEGIDGEILFVQETPAAIQAMLAYDPSKEFLQLAADMHVEQVRILSKYGISPEESKPSDPPEPT